MGCCVSTSSPSTLEKTQSLAQPKSPNQDSRAPPPSFEEETVKEVLLSEVPRTPPLQVSNNFRDHVFFVQKELPEASLSEKDLSEVCGESFSSITTCNNDYKRFNLEDENEVRKRVMKSPMRNGSGVVDLRRKQSPVKRSDRSPARRNSVGTVKLVQSKETGSTQIGRLGSRADPGKRDPNERSGRRSMSPSHHRSNVSRSPLRKMNGSPGRVGLDQHEMGNTSKRVQSGFEDTWQNRNNNGGDVTKESLENPLVSLECFIFL